MKSQASVRVFHTPTILANNTGTIAVQVNKILDTLGYQEKVNGSWEPTEKGKPWCQRRMGKNAKGQDYVQLRWDPTHIQPLVETQSPGELRLRGIEGRLAELEARLLAREEA